MIFIDKEAAMDLVKRAIFQRPKPKLKVCGTRGKVPGRVSKRNPAGIGTHNFIHGPAGASDVPSL